MITNAFRSEIPNAFLFIGIETEAEKIAQVIFDYKNLVSIMYISKQLLLVRPQFFSLVLTGICLIGFARASSLHPKTRVPIVTHSGKKDYKFNATISRNVLENYLDRSITMQSLLVGKGNFDDNLRMVKNIGAKFIGRSVCQWGEEADIPKNLQQEKELAAKVHESDPEIILAPI